MTGQPRFGKPVSLILIGQPVSHRWTLRKVPFVDRTAESRTHPKHRQTACVERLRGTRRDRWPRRRPDRAV